VAINTPENKKDDGRLNVVITFDDAFLSIATEAFPLLQRFGFPATVYFPTAFIGTGKRLLPHRPHMSWSDAERLAKNGITPGSHTVNHLNLRTMTFAKIDDELRLSKKTIEDHTGVKIYDFSCPFSFPEGDAERVRELRASLVKHGYRTGVTTRIGRADSGDDPFTLRRLPVNDDDDEALFRAKLEGAYDWLAALQQAKKRFFPAAVKKRGTSCAE
jgi:peptidoglycan/xylan/chitin deacetylase (PgdA/CDA1 family)